MELDLEKFAGTVPVEMLGQSAFPQIGVNSYMLTLPAYGFFWFDLAASGQAPSGPVPLPAFSTLVSPGNLKATIGGKNLSELQSVMPDFITGQRWFAGKSERPRGVTVKALGEPTAGSAEHLLTEVTVRAATGDQRYFLPLSARWGERYLHPQDSELPYTIAKVRQGPKIGALVDGARNPDLARMMISAIAAGQDVPLDGGRLVFTPSKTHREGLDEALAVEVDAVRPLTGEQSNTSILVGTTAILKYYRRMRDGLQPEIEITHFLTEHTDFEAAPKLYGSVELVREDGTRTAVAALFQQVQNQGDAWSVVVDALSRYLRDNAYSSQPALDEGADPAAQSEPKLVIQLDAAEVLGRRTGEMHAALATKTGDPDFDPERLDDESYMALIADAKREAGEALALLSGAKAGLPADLADDIERLLGAEKDILTWFDRFGGLKIDTHRTRIHGDYHLGQVLVSKNDVVILDFEGEPGREMEERRAKFSPLRDVAGMLRSFDYAAFAARDRAGPADETTGERLREMAETWRDETSESYLGHWATASGLSLADPAMAQLLDLFVLQKAFYELKYEAAMRPGWLSIPLRGIIALLEKRQVLK